MSKKQGMRDFIAMPEPALVGKLPEAVYTMSELHLWPDDVDSVSAKQAITCWKLIEKLRTSEFPDSLRM